MAFHRAWLDTFFLQFQDPFRFYLALFVKQETCGKIDSLIITMTGWILIRPLASSIAAPRLPLCIFRH